MELAVCYDYRSIELAWSIFLDVTAVFSIMALFAAARLIVLSRAGSVGQLQTA